MIDDLDKLVDKRIKYRTMHGHLYGRVMRVISWSDTCVEVVPDKSDDKAMVDVRDIIHVYE